MKKLTLILLSVLMIVTLAACGSKKCEQHVYDDCADTECNVCGETRDSMHSWKDATCTTLKTCTVCQATEGEMLPHNWEDATCITAKTCKTCGTTEGEPLGHEWTTPDVDLCEVQSTCSRCGATDGEKKEHTPENDDNDCSTALNCGVCGKEILAAGEHSPEKDDGNCTTEQKCTVCGQVAVAAKDAHNDTDRDYLCDNAGCQVTVGNPPKDESDGIDLPIDTNN